MHKPTQPGEYLILLYHGVYADDLPLEGRNSSGKHIAASHFERQMAQLVAHWQPVSMRQIAAAHRGEADLPARAVAVTFDDGFANNYAVAYPILRRYGVPATFYLATGFIGTGRMIWSDELESCLFNAPAGDVECFGQAWHIGDVASRIAAFTGIKRRCKALPFARIREVLHDIQAQTHTLPAPDHALYEMLDWQTVRQMAADPLIDFGAHTIDHVPVSRVAEDEMQRQISGSLDKLQSETGIAPALFSYPEGQPDDYGAAAIGWLKHLGITHCPNAVAGLNRLHVTDPFHINRVMVGFENRPFPLD